jgi:hypothetical protein
MAGIKSYCLLTENQNRQLILENPGKYPPAHEVKPTALNYGQSIPLIAKISKPFRGKLGANQSLGIGTG